MPSSNPRMPPLGNPNELSGSKPSEAPPPRGSRIPNLLVLAAMALVGMAVGFGLYVQASVSPVLASIWGLSLLGVLVAVHFAWRRSAQAGKPGRALNGLEPELGSRPAARQGDAGQEKARPAARVPARGTTAGSPPADRLQMALARGSARADRARTAKPARPPGLPTLEEAAKAGQSMKDIVRTQRKALAVAREAVPEAVHLEAQRSRRPVALPPKADAAALAAPEGTAALTAPEEAAALAAPEEAAALESSLSSLALPAPPPSQPERQASAPPAVSPPRGPAGNEADVVTSVVPVPPPLPRPTAANPDAAHTDDEISRSVEALRATASQMQAFDEPRGSSAEPVFEQAAGAETGSRTGAVVIASTDGRAGVDVNETAAEARDNDAIVEALASDRVEVFVDPIMGLGDRRARHFEVRLQLKTVTGQSLDKSEYDSVLAENGLRPRLDVSRLVSSTDLADHLLALGKQASVISNYSGESLAHDLFLDQLAEKLNNRDQLAGYLVLSFAQADVRDFGEVHWDTLDTLRELGFRFALEDLTDLDMDFGGLKDYGFDFVKLDAQLFLHGLPQADAVVSAADLCRHLAGVGQSLIVGHIEDEMELGKVLGFGVLLGQGRMFGAPRALKPAASAKAKTAAA